MKRLLLSSVVWGLAAVGALARTLTTGTVVCNPGVIVSVPLAADDLTDVGAASFVLNYDPTVVVCLGVDAGPAVAAGEFSSADTGAGHLILSVGAFRKKGGAIASIRLLAREGTQGLYSDVTIAEADLAARDGLTDFSAANPVKTVNGMVRVLGTSAEAARLESGFVVWPKTALRALTLAAGDGVKASDDGSPVVVSGAVNTTGEISVDAPPSGWQTGTYALLSTPTRGLSFSLADAPDAAVRTETAGGVTTYYADVTVAGSAEIVAESGTLPPETRAQVKALLADALAAHPDVMTVKVKGDAALIPVAADLGIAPQFDVLGTTATATYATPTLVITAFDPKTGLVRIRVTPGAGNSIRAPLATGCIHVYGTDSLQGKMRYIGHTSIDLTPYLKDATKGEADLTVALGSHTFIKVKAEETTKQEGEEE